MTNCYAEIRDAARAYAAARAEHHAAHMGQHGSWTCGRGGCGPCPMRERLSPVALAVWDGLSDQERDCAVLAACGDDPRPGIQPNLDAMRTWTGASAAGAVSSIRYMEARIAAYARMERLLAD